MSAYGSYDKSQRGLTEQDGCMLRCSTGTTVDHVVAFDGVNVVQSVCTHTLVLQPITHMYTCSANQRVLRNFGSVHESCASSCLICSESQDSWTEPKFRSTRWFALHVYVKAGLQRSQGRLSPTPTSSLRSGTPYQHLGHVLSASDIARGYEGRRGITEMQLT